MSGVLRTSSDSQTIMFNDQCKNLSFEDVEYEEDDCTIPTNGFNLMNPHPGLSGERLDTENTLGLLRKTLQKSFNDDVSQIILEYYQIFRRAADNIYMNTNEMIQPEAIYKQISLCLEEAKDLLIYPHDEREIVPKMNSMKLSYPTSYNQIYTQPTDTRLMIKQQKMAEDVYIHQSTEYTQPQPMIVPITLPNAYLSPAISPCRENTIGMWDPSLINSDTEYVNGARANRLVGYSNARGRIYTRHPSLFKYHTDPVDRQWLSDNNYMSPMSGRAILLLLQDFLNLLEHHEDYRGKIKLTLDDIKPFKVPDWMSVKIKSSMKAQLENIFYYNR